MVEKLIYLDFETSGLNSEINKLLTIQWQENVGFLLVIDGSRL